MSRLRRLSTDIYRERAKVEAAAEKIKNAEAKKIKNSEAEASEIEGKLVNKCASRSIGRS